MSSEGDLAGQGEEEEGTGERKWIESEWLKEAAQSTIDDEEEIEIGTDLFADPDPLETFRYQFESSKSGTIQIELTGFKAELGQTLHSTGLTLWRASSLLCDYMVSQEETIGSSDSVLELGAGLGMCGILASKLGARQAVLTDGDTDTLARMRENVAANASKAACAQLVWGENIDQFAERHGGTFDLILGSDIIYVEEILEPLWDTVDILLAKKGGMFWLAYARRNVSIDLVLAQATKRGFIWTTPDASEGVYVFTREA